MTLVVVSNRVARGKANEPITGGLAAALLPVVEQSGAIWVGLLGLEGDGHQNEPSAEMLGRGKLVSLDLPDELYRGYYEGFANSALWHALHSRPDLIKVSERDYASYREVNAVTARKLRKFKEPAAFWVHDYHFLALGAELRNVGIGQPIGFFLHTPWPEPAAMRKVPHHRELIEAMLDYDLIGFQTGESRQHFLDYVGTDLGLTIEDGVVIWGHSRTRCRVFPIGIDVDKFAKDAKASFAPRVSRLLSTLDSQSLAIGVDRIDYSKGLDKRICAFDHLWTKEPRFVGSLSLLQIANPSRSAIETYRNLQDHIRGLVREVNGRHCKDKWTPISYHEDGFSQAELAVLYRTAKIAVVTPLRDGMNLVAKEYVAAQNPDDPGVLVLSKFAGAAKELDGALLVDPNDVVNMVRAFSRALSMPPVERRSRWTAMMEKLRDYPIQRWTSDFMAELKKSRPEKIASEFIPRDLGAPSGSRQSGGEDDSAGASSHLDQPRQFVDPAIDLRAGLPANDFGHLVDLGWKHGPQPAPDVLFGALNRIGALPRPCQLTTHFYIHGQPYTAQLGAGKREGTPNNPLGIDVILIPRTRGG
ncbi:trehalose-6-phosphate synthase [Bradyrhizobium sp. CNPSo 4026]|nr:trehalose-6-phosphate synthase [Bradyrhizobium cenepequi]